MIEPLIVKAGTSDTLDGVYAFRNLTAGAGASAQVNAGRSYDLSKTLRTIRARPQRPFKVKFTAPANSDLVLEYATAEDDQLEPIAQNLLNADGVLDTVVQGEDSAGVSRTVRTDTSGRLITSGEWQLIEEGATAVSATTQEDPTFIGSRVDGTRWRQVRVDALHDGVGQSCNLTAAPLFDNTHYSATGTSPPAAVLSAIYRRGGMLLSPDVGAGYTSLTPYKAYAFIPSELRFAAWLTTEGTAPRVTWKIYGRA